MYIWDALYGKIEFGKLIYQCMLTPEVQRLREVRLCNINSLCITGSANTNRYEHSVGTAFLAQINIESKLQKHLRLSKQDKEVFIIAALLHDIANGPFGHSYAYIREKTGFIPEQGLCDLFNNVVATGTGAYKNETPFEPIFFRKLRQLTSLLTEKQKLDISNIVSGKHHLSKLISASIDLDNIDNVFRMAFHMGLSFRKEAPIKLATMMFIEDDEVKFLKEAKTYLDEWYIMREKVYKFLLLNPQEFAGKYMLTEAMDILFECIAQNQSQGITIKWNYTDYQLMNEIDKLKEVWIKRKTLLTDKIDEHEINKIVKQNNDKQKYQLKEYIEGIHLDVPIKEKGKKSKTDHLLLSDNFSYEIKVAPEPNNTVNIINLKNRNMEFYINQNKMYKIVLVRYNPSKIVSRLMTGDLYCCLLIMQTSDITKYNTFLEYEKRITIEDELETRIHRIIGYKSLSLGIHPILDVNKTERQLIIHFKGDSSNTTVGNISSKKLLLGVFIKNEPYGLEHGDKSSNPKLEILRKTVKDYLTSFFNHNAEIIPLYEEADRYGN